MKIYLVTYMDGTSDRIMGDSTICGDGLVTFFKKNSEEGTVVAIHCIKRIDIMIHKRTVANRD